MIKMIFLGLFVAISNISLAFFLQYVIDIGMSYNYQQFNMTILYAIFLTLAIFISEIFYSCYSKRWINKQLSSLMELSIKHIFTKKALFFEKNEKDRIITLMNNDIKLLEENLYIPLVELIRNLAMFILATLIMAITNLMITGIVILLSFPIFIIPLEIGNHLKKSQCNLSEEYTNFNNILDDIINGYKIISLYKKNTVFKKRILTKERNLFDIKNIFDKNVALSTVFSSIITIISQLVILVVALALLFYGSITLGMLLLITQLSNNIMYPFDKYTWKCSKNYWFKNHIIKIQF